MTATGTIELARAWVAAQSSYDLGAATDSDWSIIFAVQRLTDSQPEVLWEFVLRAIEQEPSASVRDTLAAGPLEDLIAYHGAAFVDRIVQEADGNPAFAALLPKVWLSASDDLVTQRFARLGCDLVRAAV